MLYNNKHIENTACFLYESAINLDPRAFHSIGEFKSLVLDYNRFAKSNGFDTLEHNNIFKEDGFGQVSDSSSHMLPSIKRELKKIIRTNDFKCKISI